MTEEAKEYLIIKPYELVHLNFSYAVLDNSKYFTLLRTRRSAQQ
jgi:hypothetical protein